MTEQIGRALALAALLMLPRGMAAEQTRQRGTSDRQGVVNVRALAEQQATLVSGNPKIRPHGPMPINLPTPSGVPTLFHESLRRGFQPQSPRSLQGSGRSPAPALSFQGAGDNGLSIPPDTMGAVGPNHLVVTINGTFRILTRAGTPVSTITLDAFWSSVGPFSGGAFDPKIYYEPYVNRWIIVACADAVEASSGVLIGVSQTSDPTGNWNLYRIQADTNGRVWADYPSLGFNKDWIVVSMNMFDIITPGNSGPFNREHVYIFDKANLLAGGAAATHTLITDPSAFTLVPAVTYDPLLGTIYLLQNVSGNAGGVGTLRIYDITGAIGAESLNVVGNVTTAAGWDDQPTRLAPQLGSVVTIENNDARMQNLVYRNGSLWAAHTVFLPVSAGTRSSVQWWQLNPTGAIIQRGLIDDPFGGLFYGFPSIAVNKNDDAMIGYSTFSANQFASAAYSVRVSSDPLNTMESSQTLKAGLGPYFKTFFSGENRWGDYSATVVDPVNDVDMWTLQEYADTPQGNVTQDNSGRWAVWWGQVSLSTPPDGILEVSVAPLAGSVLRAGTTVPFFVTVSDTLPVTNATVQATIPGVFTNQFFLNNGAAPDALLDDNVYSFNVVLPPFNTNVTLTLLITAPGKTTSTNVFTYTVATPPGNDYFSAAFKVPDNGGIISGYNTFASLEPGEPRHAGIVTMTNSVWWYWAPTNTGNALVDLTGSGFNTILAVYTNNTINTLGLVGAVDDVGTKSRGFLNFDITAGVTYHIAVAGFGPLDVGSVQMRVEIGGHPDTNAPVVIVTSPANGIITTNGTITVTGTATDPAPDVSGVTQVLVSVNSNPPVLATGSNNWSAIVQLQPGTNSISIVAIDLAENISVPAKINVNYRLFDPLNDHFVNALSLDGTSGVVGTNTVKASSETGEPLHAGKQGGKSVWWFFIAPANGTLFLSTTNSNFDTLLGVYTGTRVNALTTVASNDDAGPGLTHSETTVAVLAGQTYYVAVDGLAGASGLAVLQYSFSPIAVFTVQITAANGGVAPGSGSYASNSIVTFTAVPAANFEFVTWQGDALTTENPLSLTITKNLSLTAVFLPRIFADDFETGDLLKLPWTAAGNLPWVAQATNALQTTMVFGGRFFARSGAIGDNQTSSLKLTAGMFGGPASFGYRVSTESGYDFFEFYINGVRQLNLSGETGWQNYNFTLAAGTNSLEWRFVKDSAFSGNLDAVFLDNVNLPIFVPKDLTFFATHPGTGLLTNIVRQADGNMRFRFAGQTNQVYHVQASGDLFNWQTIGTNIARQGLIQFADPQSTNFPVRYYRLIVP